MDSDWGTTVTTSTLSTRRRGAGREGDKNEGTGGMSEDDAGPVGSHACDLNHIVH